MKNYSTTLIITLSFVFFVSSCAKKSSQPFTEQKDTSIQNENIQLDELQAEILKLEDAKKHYTQIKFDKTTHNFGQIQSGEIVSTVFLIKNVGNKPLKLTKVSGSCGCTVPQIDTSSVIPQNQSREILVEFNSKGRFGQQRKFVKVFGNFEPSPSLLEITADVLHNDRE